MGLAIFKSFRFKLLLISFYFIFNYYFILLLVKKRFSLILTPLSARTNKTPLSLSLQSPGEIL